MRYHVVVYEVPEPGRDEQEPVIDEEFDSDWPVDEALIEWAADWHDESQEP